MRLSPEKFNALLGEMGQSFIWSKAYACPCINPNSGQPKTNCLVCHGIGRFWDSPITGTAGVVGRDVMKKMSGFGLWDAGDIMLSIPSDSPLYALGMYDKVAALNRTEPFSMNFVAGINDILRFRPQSIDRVTWLDSSQNLIEGTIPEINADGTLLWEGVQPPSKATYSMTGRRYPDYFCYDELPLDRAHFHGDPLPRRVVVRRFELYGN